MQGSEVSEVDSSPQYRLNSKNYKIHLFLYLHEWNEYLYAESTSDTIPGDTIPLIFSAQAYAELNNLCCGLNL
jgi:hypothetical protein